MRAYFPRYNRTWQPGSDPFPVDIESLDQEGRGVARRDGKAMFVEGALTGERVDVVILKDKPSYAIARIAGVRKSSAARVTPRCPHFGVCGGCTLQHAHPAMQIAAKQRALEDALARIGRVRPEVMLPPIEGPAWHYRYRARMSVRHVAKKGGVLVGFHERKSSFVADMTECHVVPPKLSALLVPLRELVAMLSVRDRLPQIEVAIGEHDNGLVYALVLRILAPLTAEDEALLLSFADAHGVEFWLQTGGPATVVPLAKRHAARLCAAGVRDHDAVRTDRVHAGQLRRQSRARAARGRPARAGAGRADRGLLLRPRQLHAADRAPGRARHRRRRQRRARAARRGERRTQRPCRSRPFRHRQSFAPTPESLAALGRLDRALDRSAARGRGGARQGLAAEGGARRLAADRLRELRAGNARARRLGARARARLSAGGGGRGQHVSAHGARGVDRALRNKNGAPKRPVWCRSLRLSLGCP